MQQKIQRLQGFQTTPETLDFLNKQMTGVEPASPAWEAGVLPMNYICKFDN